MRFSIAIAKNAPTTYPAIYKKDIFETVRKVRDFGYNGIEWHLRRPDASETEKMQKHCDELKMSVNAIGTGMACLYDGLTLMHAYSDTRLHAVERLKEFVDMAAMLECTVIIGSMKGKIPLGKDRARYEGYCIEGLKAVQDYAGTKNVPLVLEVLNRYETNFLNTIEQMSMFIEKVGCPFLKAHIDTFHMNIEEADIHKSILKCRNILGHVHFADSNRYCPGEGHINFKSVMQALKEIDYQGWIAFECLTFSNPDAAAQSAIGFLSTL